ncbi:MAG TPA: hypothetical protein VEP49_02875 [Acidimicrobiia bacterium]|nr:hypothetical protein [Acidimicrobiia bacterium]
MTVEPPVGPPDANGTPDHEPAPAAAPAPATAPMPAPAPAVEGFAVTIGDIGVTRTLIVTANGNAPLAGSRWIVLDQSRTEKKIPTWAIVLAVVFALLCLLGLLFLLVKEEQTTGYVEVSVMSGPLTHVTQIPVRSQYDVAAVRQQVHQAQTLAAAAQT